MQFPYSGAIYMKDCDTDQFEWWVLDEQSISDSRLINIDDVDALAGQCLDNTAMACNITHYRKPEYHRKVFVLKSLNTYDHRYYMTA